MGIELFRQDSIFLLQCTVFLLITRDARVPIGRCSMSLNAKIIL
jgi:hypothetical protein